MKQNNLSRTIHRFLGLIIGIQILLWTISGIYFSWTNLDRIHGDHFKNPGYEPGFYTDLYPISEIYIPGGVQAIELREVEGFPYYWINGEQLFHAQTGEIKEGISKSEAIGIVQQYLRSDLEIASVELITETGRHHEYRGRPLPAYVIKYQENHHLKAYVSTADGKFQTVRHQGWRVFDFLWMIHTMDYRGRDNFNTFLLRGFALLGLFTVVSGFTLWISTRRNQQ